MTRPQWQVTSLEEFERARRRRARRTIANALMLPPLGITGWAFGQGLQHHMPWLSGLMVVAALCQVATYWLSMWDL